MKVVFIGGGNGGSISAVALKRNVDLFEISAIVGMSDSGRLNGQLRKKYGILPPADVLRVALAMSSWDYPTLKEMFYTYRFTGLKKLNGFNLGYLYFLGAWRESGDFVESLRALEQGVGAQGHVYPNTLELAHLCAKLSNGKTIKTEGVIDRPKYDRNINIVKVWLEPQVRADVQALKRINEAEVIVLSAGSLYSSVIASLLPLGIYEAIKKSKAKLIYVAGSAYEKIGETGETSLSGMVSALESYLPRPVDYVLYDKVKLTTKQKKFYQEKKWGIIKFDPENLPGKNIIAKDFERDSGGLCSIKLGKILKNILWK